MVFDMRKNMLDVNQSWRHVRGEIDLGDVAGNDGFGVGSQAGQKHLHLTDGGVLGPHLRSQRRC